MLRKTIVSLIFATFLFSIQMAFIPFGDAWVKFYVRVIDTEGQPIKGAQIKILFDGKPESGHSETQSDDFGMYKFFENSYPGEFEFLVIAAKDGYKIYTKKMTGKEANKLENLDIVLVRN